MNISASIRPECVLFSSNARALLGVAGMIALAAEPDSLKYLASWLVILPAEAPSQATNCTHYLSFKASDFQYHKQVYVP